jgi:MSHA biogenesis protein MshJ
VTAFGVVTNKLRGFAERLDALSLRERGLIFTGCVALIYVAAHTLFMGPIAVRAQNAGKRLEAARQSMAAIEQAGARTDADPVFLAAARNTSLTGRLELLDAELRVAAQGYVAPDKVVNMLREILADQQGLQLVSLSTLPVESLSHPPRDALDTGPVGDDVGPFLHPVEMVVEGSYSSVVQYLRALEAMPWQVHWQQLELTAGDYPVNRVRIVIGALSLSREWLNL